MNKVVIFQCDYYVAVYLNEKLIFEGHELSTVDAIKLGTLAQGMKNVTIYEHDDDDEDDLCFTEDLKHVDFDVFNLSKNPSDLF